MNPEKMQGTLDFIRSLYPGENPVPLHAPRFFGREKEYLAECIDTTYVSYVGKFVTDFEEHIKRISGARHAIAMVNGTAALQISLIASNVHQGDLVITQALTFAATAAAIRHAGADPVFVDVDVETMGMGPTHLRDYLEKNGVHKDGVLHDRKSGRRFAAIVPMHTFGHPVAIEKISGIAREFGIPLIEDAAESLGSYYKGTHTGTFGDAGILSFNGNKPVTTGGGGMIITNDDALAERARHLSTTAKVKHPWNFVHDEVGYNLRMPNINAAVGCAQIEKLDFILENKRKTAQEYEAFFQSNGVSFFTEPVDCRSNYWLNAIILEDRAERDQFLEFSNGNGVQTRPIWTLMNKLPPYEACAHGPLDNSIWLEDRVINIPSSVRK